MKKLLFSTLLILFLVQTPQVAFPSEASNNVSPSPTNHNTDEITVIRSIYYNINENLSRYKLNEFDINDQSAEGGTVQIYTDNHEVKKIVEVYYGETGKTSYEFYYDNNRLRFVFQQTVNYNVPLYHNPSIDGGDAFDISKSTVLEDRYYFHDGNMIEWLDHNRTDIAKDTPNFIQRQNELLNSSFFNEAAL